MPSILGWFLIWLELHLHNRRESARDLDAARLRAVAKQEAFERWRTDRRWLRHQRD